MTTPLPAYAERRAIGRAVEPYEWVIRARNVSRTAKRLRAEGWRLYPSGPYHIVIWRADEEAGNHG